MPILLTVVIFFPFVAALVLILLHRGDDATAQNNARRVALCATIATFLVSLFLLIGFDSTSADFQFVEEYHWIAGFTYKIGVDGISLPLVLLTTVLMPFVIGATGSVKERVKDYMVAFLMLETLMVGVFCALDLVLFYLFFEAGLIPMFLIIGIWGGQRRIYATFKFFLYTLLGSLLMLIAMLVMYRISGTTDIVDLLRYRFASNNLALFGWTIPGGLQTFLWLAFFASFAVKMPMWPVHTWLPDAHVEAPTAGSVVLAAVLLKMGGYGFLRFSIPMFPVASHILADFVFWLSVIAIIYTSLVALAQTDMKKLIAYSSVAHMGYVTAGIFAANRYGIEGAMFQMISHGFISGGLFLCVGVIYDRTHTRNIDAYGGLVNRMPRYALVFMILTLANVGLPGTSGFVGEFLTLIGLFQISFVLTALAASGIILSACYGLWLYKRVVFGDLIKESLKTINDMTIGERMVLYPFVFVIIGLGVYPSAITKITETSVQALVNTYNARLQDALVVPNITTSTPVQDAH